MLWFIFLQKSRKYAFVVDYASRHLKRACTAEL